MNTDQDGPYVCNAPGCTQRFQREDHLIIHRHKHEMTLKFASIRCDNTLSDQTPTPTRFLRNCEEVGLFSDLDLNRASDEDEEETKQNFSVQASSGETPSECHGSQQQQQQQQCALAQFHTSHLHSHNSHALSHCSMLRHTAAHSTTNTQSDPSCLHTQQRHPVACAMQAPPPVHMNTQLAVDPSMMEIPGPAHSRSCHTPQRSKVMTCQTHPMVSNGNQNPMGHMMDMMPQQHVRMGLPLTHVPASPHPAYQQHGLGQSLQRHAPSQEQSPHSCAHHSPPAHLHPGPVLPAAKHLAHQPIPAQVSPVPKNTPCAESPPQTSGGKRRRTADEDPDERRRKFLERNRAAASRCRQKRKIWVVSLEKKAEELTHTNLQLQNEVTLLKSEVIQLKQLLLAHKDCPVTVRQRETHVGSPTGSPLQTQNVQHNSVSSSSTTAAHTHLTTHSRSAS